MSYSYRELKEYPDSVEVIGVVVPNNRTVLEIPETLDGKSVISLDLDSNVLPDQDKAEVGIKKLVLSKKIRPLKAGTKDGKVKYLPLWGLFRLESIEVAKGNKYLKAKDGVLYNADMSAMLEYPRCKKETLYRMPSSVTFSMDINNDHLKKLTFSNNKKYTSAYVSWCENLESIYFPDNVKEVSGFYGAHKLKKKRWSRNLQTIGERAFENAISLRKVRFPGKVREIGADAFRWCSSLEDISLPDSVAYVGSGAFAKVPGIDMDMKKASFLLSPKNKKIKGRVPDYYRYIAVAAMQKGKKHKYYDSQRINMLKPSEKSVYIRAGRSKGKIKGLKKGKAVITIRMRTSDEKCRVKVTVA